MCLTTSTQYNRRTLAEKTVNERLLTTMLVKAYMGGRFREGTWPTLEVFQPLISPKGDVQSAKHYSGKHRFRVLKNSQKIGLPRNCASFQVKADDWVIGMRGLPYSSSGSIAAQIIDPYKGRIVSNMETRFPTLDLPASRMSRYGHTCRAARVLCKVSAHLVRKESQRKRDEQKPFRLTAYAHPTVEYA